MAKEYDEPRMVLVEGRPGFRFTEWGLPGRPGLDNWQEWFAELGIVSEIRSNRSGKTALFRQGRDAAGSVAREREG